MKSIVLFLAFALIISACSKELEELTPNNDTHAKSAMTDPRPQLIGIYCGIRNGSHLGAGAGGGSVYTSYPDSSIAFGVFLSGTNDLALEDSTTLSLDSIGTDYYRYIREEMTFAPYESTNTIWTLEFFPSLDSLSYHYDYSYNGWSHSVFEHIYFRGTK